MAQKFKCLYCYHCCVFKDKDEMPLVFYWEKEQLENLAKQKGVTLQFEEFLTVDYGQERFIYIYRWLIDGRCPFFNKENKCDIHSNKPLTCRIYPLVLEIPDLKIHLTGKCDWVQENINTITPENLPKIFEDEFRVAVKLLAMLNEFFEEAKKNKWKIIVNTG